ncbi:MAG: 4Fe-4S dicluster domain protein [candidate division BRC1 bacterium ADurb.BinA364]|nr:MAG: 4Fe-4S dicluster domain protein [candidate division BRC1 bacterium ADurb.BinA364]
MQDEIRSLVRQKLEAGEIDLFLGYGQGTLPGRVKPLEISDPNQAGQLIWNENCDHNLTNYLVRHKGKTVGILVKPCDSRTLVTLIKENQVERARVWALGVRCPGVKSQVDGKAQLQIQCLSCDIRTPPLADAVVGPEVDPGAVDLDDPFERMTPKERWERFRADMERCIRCYACRNACPVCYCKVCFVDQAMPTYVSPGNDTVDSAFFQIGRLMHIAGRCGECGACTRVCPMNIPLGKLTRKVAHFLEKTYGAKAGMSLEEPDAFGAFSPDDDNSMFL